MFSLDPRKGRASKSARPFVFDTRSPPREYESDGSEPPKAGGKKKETLSQAQIQADLKINAQEYRDLYIEIEREFLKRKVLGKSLSKEDPEELQAVLETVRNQNLQLLNRAANKELTLKMLQHIAYRVQFNARRRKGSSQFQADPVDESGKTDSFARSATNSASPADDTESTTLRGTTTESLEQENGSLKTETESYLRENGIGGNGKRSYPDNSTEPSDATARRNQKFSRLNEDKGPPEPKHIRKHDDGNMRGSRGFDRAANHGELDVFVHIRDAPEEPAVLFPLQDVSGTTRAPVASIGDLIDRTRLQAFQSYLKAGLKLRGGNDLDIRYTTSEGRVMRVFNDGTLQAGLRDMHSSGLKIKFSV